MMTVETVYGMDDDGKKERIRRFLLLFTSIRQE